jgi:hypothetical protein
VVIATNDAAFSRLECPQPQIVHKQLDPAFLKLTSRFAATAYDRAATRTALRASGTGVKMHLSHESFDRAVLLKWALVGFTEYELVLLVDADVDFYEVGRRSAQGVRAYLATAARAWAEGLARFRRSSAELIASADAEAPINAGLVWIKPSAAAYDEGLALLRTMRFSAERGFNDSGRPSELLEAGAAASWPLNGTRFVALDSWNMVAGASDQGLYTHVFAIRRRTLAFARRADYQLHHFWSASKPWVRFGSCFAYYYALGIVDSPTDGADPRAPTPNMLPVEPRRQRGHCWPKLRQMAEKLRGYENTSKRRLWGCRGQSFPLF